MGSSWKLEGISPSIRQKWQITHNGLYVKWFLARRLTIALTSLGTSESIMATSASSGQPLPSDPVSRLLWRLALATTTLGVVPGRGVRWVTSGGLSRGDPKILCSRPLGSQDLTHLVCWRDGILTVIHRFGFISSTAVVLLHFRSH